MKEGFSSTFETSVVPVPEYELFIQESLRTNLNPHTGIVSRNGRTRPSTIILLSRGARGPGVFRRRGYEVGVCTLSTYCYINSNLFLTSPSIPSTIDETGRQ